MDRISGGEAGDALMAGVHGDDPWFAAGSGSGDGS